MSTGPQIAWLPDGRRLHLHHGPIDLIVEAEGPDRAEAYRRAVERFRTILEELVEELPSLRRPAAAGTRFNGSTARRMRDATLPHRPAFITPMAAVAGAVADEVLGHMCAGTLLTKAHVNNGGDIAFYLARGAHVRALAPAGEIRIDHDRPARGIATSGWRGRSHSLGIADAVTVAARTAASADAAATLIANAVDLPGHPAIARAPAATLSPDSDLGERLVTTGVGPLAGPEIDEALERGVASARDMLQRKLICEAVLVLGNRTRVVSPLPELEGVTADG